MTFSLGIVALVILVVDMLFGLGRGFGKSVVRLVTQIFSAVAAYFAAKVLVSNCGEIAYRSLQDALQDNQALATMVADNPETVEALSVFAGTLVAPLLFFICYLLFKLLTLIVYAILCKVLGIGKSGKKKNGGSRVLGLAVGAVAGFVGILVLVIPVFGYVDLAVSVISAVEETGIVEEMESSGGDAASAETTGASSAELFAEYEEYLVSVGETPVLSVVYSNVGSPIFEGLTTAKIEEKPMVLKTEIMTVLEAGKEAKSLAGKDFSSYGEAESFAVHSLAEKMGDSVILTYIGSAALKELSDAWTEGGNFLGMERPSLNDNAGILINGFLTMFSTSSPDNIKDDLVGFADIFSVCVKYHVFSYFSAEANGEDLLTQVAFSGFLGEIRDIITSTPRMLPIYNALSDIGMRYMLNELGLPADYAEKYPELMEDMSGAVRSLYDENGNVDREGFKENIGGVLAENDVTVSESALELIADGIAENFTKEEIDNMTDEEIQAALIERFGSAEAAIQAVSGLNNEQPES